MKTHTRRIAAAVLFAFLPATVSLPVQAQPGDDPVTVQARARFKEGVDYYDKGKYEEARLAFLQAYTLKKHPAVLLNLAQSTAKANHPLEASKYFQQFLKEATTATPQQKKDAETGLAEVRGKLGRIEIIAPAGTDISLDDGGKIGTAPFTEPIDVEPGPHTLKSSTETQKVIATVGQKVEAKFGAASGSPAVVPVAPPTSGGSGANPPPSNPPGGEGGSTPQPPSGEQPGTKKAGLLSPPESMTPVYIGLTFAGIGLVGAIVFAAFKADAQSKADSVANEIRSAAAARGLNTQGVCSNSNPSVQKDFGTACKTLKENNDKVDTNATVANISLVVMGVGLLTAAGWYLFAPKRDEGRASSDRSDKSKTVVSERPVLTPWVGYQTGGLTLSGAF
jgi:hypothetical protein